MTTPETVVPENVAAAGFDDREFYELFRKSTADWPTSVAQVTIDESTAPFVAWNEKPDKITY